MSKKRKFPQKGVMLKLNKGMSLLYCSKEENASILADKDTTYLVDINGELNGKPIVGFVYYEKEGHEYTQTHSSYNKKLDSIFREKNFSEYISFDQKVVPMVEKGYILVPKKLGVTEEEFPWYVVPKRTFYALKNSLGLEVEIFH